MEAGNFSANEGRQRPPLPSLSVAHKLGREDASRRHVTWRVRAPRKGVVVMLVSLTKEEVGALQGILAKEDANDDLEYAAVLDSIWRKLQDAVRQEKKHE